MIDDINNPKKLILSDLERIRFVESKPYSDLSSGFTSFAEQEVEDTIEVTEKEDFQLPLETLVANFSLVEAGTSFVVCKGQITDKNCPIEYIGNGEYRVYIGKTIKQGLVRNSSPGYFVTDRGNLNKIENRGIKIGYNSGIEKNKIDFISNEHIKIKALHCWLEKDNFINIVTKQNHGLKKGSIVDFTGKSINGTYTIHDCTDNILTIFDANISQESTLDLPYFYSYTGTKVYCNVSNLSVGDKVVFDYMSGKGIAHTINAIEKDSNGIFFHVNENIEKFAETFIVSHEVDESSLIEFGPENHLSYYDVVKIDPKTHKLWLTYIPDALPHGRKNQTISYIQFYSSHIFKAGV